MKQNTKAFRTPTLEIPMDNPKTKLGYGIGIDFGYSSAKAFAPNKVFAFPYYAKRVIGTQINFGLANSKNDILYKDMNGNVWQVGAEAQNTMSVLSTEDSSETMYGRNRFYTEMFTVIARTGIGKALKGNVYGKYETGTPLYVQTGLPSKYMPDKEDLINALQGHHEFYLKFGNGDWEKYEYDLPKTHIRVIPQPLGTLQSICRTKEGRMLSTAGNYMSKNLLIIDPGFGTFDTFTLKHQMNDSHETYPELSMNAVLQATSDEIYAEYKHRIEVPVMQKYLETGEIKIRVKSTDLASRKPITKKIEFGDILSRHCETICTQALNKIMSVYNDLLEFDYLVVTGGLGAAWMPYIKSYFEDMEETLSIIPGNQNDERLSFIFANCRGYYMMLLDYIKLSNNGKIK